MCLRVYNTSSKLQAQLKPKEEICECWRFKPEPKIFSTYKRIKGFDVKYVMHCVTFII